jgi:hypothetical protein
MRRVFRLLVLIALTSGCAIPGRLYEVAPAISGRVHGGSVSKGDASGRDVSKNGARLMLQVANEMSADLYAREQVRLSPDGSFAFESLRLAVAGHEYNKNYRVLLRLRVDEKERVIWRAAYPRRALAGAVALDCDLDRPVEHGQPCWVRDPLQHPWLIAEGERTYRRLCASCHGIDGSGEVAPAKTPDGSPAADLRKIAARHGGRFDRAAVTEWIEGRSSPTSHGTRRMPIWGERLSSEYERYADSQALIAATIDPLVVYLESLQQTD